MIKKTNRENLRGKETLHLSLNNNININRSIIDIHIDFYFKINPTRSAVKSIYFHIFTDNQTKRVGDVLIVAGDLGHNNKQTIQVLELIKEACRRDAAINQQVRKYVLS